MAQNLERIYVDPEFKKLLRVGAALKGKNIAEFTRELKGIDGLSEVLKQMKEKSKKQEKRLCYDFP